MYNRLRLLKVKDIYQLQVLKFVYESIKKDSIVQFHGHFTHQNTIHSHNTRNIGKLYSRRARTNYGQSTLHFVGTKLWNALDSDLYNSKSIYIFKRALKQIYIDSYR